MCTHQRVLAAGPHWAQVWLDLAYHAVSFVSRGGSPCWWGCNLRDRERRAGGTARAVAPQHIPLLLPAPSAPSPVLQHTCKGLGGSCVDLACVKTFSVVLYFNLDNISSNSPWSLKAHQAPHRHAFTARQP